jgi:hypothetical protein
VTWITWSAGRWNPGVIMGAVPASRGEPRASIASAQESLKCGPAARWMMLSMHLWSGWKQPRPALLAAFTERRQRVRELES